MGAKGWVGRGVKAHINEGETIEKARAMIRRGKTDGEVSDYLGMIESQVRTIRGRVFRGRGRPSNADAAQQDFERLDALSRQRALTDAESITLEKAIRILDERDRYERRRAA